MVLKFPCDSEACRQQCQPQLLSTSRQLSSPPCDVLFHLRGTRRAKRAQFHLACGQSSVSKRFASLGSEWRHHLSAAVRSDQSPRQPPAFASVALDQSTSLSPTGTAAQGL